jgi:hypothetical protein
MRVDNRVAERRPHKELDQRKPGRIHPAGTGRTRRGLIAIGKTTSPATGMRSGGRLGVGRGFPSRFSWGGPPGVRSSSRWRLREGQAS